MVSELGVRTGCLLAFEKVGERAKAKVRLMESVKERGRGELY